MAPDHFARCVRVIFDAEGGFVDHPADPGGATKYGISLRFLRRVRKGATVADIRALTVDDARALYRRYFWDRCRCDDLPPQIALGVLDAAVNQGVRRASRILQRVLKLKTDGIIGSVTVAAAARAEPRWLCQMYFAERTMAYAKTRNFAVFGRGWINRTIDVLMRTVAGEY